MGEVEAIQEKIARLTRERDEMATQASACADEVDRVRVEIGAVQAENARLTTALAESERKREEEISAEREACAAVCDERAKHFEQPSGYREWSFAARSYRATAKDIRKRATVRAALATPTQETPHVES